MGKYANLQADVFSIFAGASWKAENIKTYPMNTISINSGNEFIRVDIIPRDFGVNLASTSGVLIIDIFTSAGSGPTAATLIADRLDAYLVGKSISTVSNVVTQFQNSSMKSIGRDFDNTTLFRSVYSIPFHYFGVM